MTNEERAVLEEEYRELEELRREASDARDFFCRGGILNTLFSWVVQGTEQYQKEILDEIYKRKN